jgi:UDP-N-acetylmuramoyl-tripeptide--D-alanyl-D-alanine ligase
MFKVNELLKATRGRLISGKADTIVKGISIDSRTIRPQEAFIAIKGCNFDGHNFINAAVKKRAGAVIFQRQGLRVEGKEVAFIEVKDTIKALGDIARFQRQKFDIPVIAVTGSNGKTTTKEMIAWILSKEFNVLRNVGTKNNQIGLPLTLLNLNRHKDVVVVEVGTNHPGEIEYLARICQPNIGIIINVGSSHLEYLINLKGVFKEKSALLKHLKSPHIAILNADDGLLKRQIPIKNRKLAVLGFGIKHRSDFFATGIKILNGRIKFSVNHKYGFTLKTLGYFNIYNALAALTVARLFGMEYRDIASRLLAFNFPQSRLEFLELNNTKFINDTYNSNPVSFKQAIEVLENFPIKGRKIFVMGDMLELGNRRELFHRQAGRNAARICDVFITVGELSKLAAKAAMDFGLDSKNIFTCASSLQAQDILFNRVSPGPDDIVLVKGSRAMRMEEILKK